MSTWWKSGQFKRELIHPVFHPFTPAHAVDSLVQINLQYLWDQGKRLLLVDVDNTLVEWRGEDFAPAVIEWLEHAKKLGFEICIISNTNRVDRLERIKELLGVEAVRGRFKPSRAMFRLALIKFKRKPHEAIMIGDQMMTDILGANRSGIDAIWVRKMEGQEFGPTAINRFVEKMLTSWVYRALVTPVDEIPAEPALEKTKPLAQRTLFQQFVKFCVVGVTSFVVDFSIRWLLMFVLPWGDRLLSQVFGDWLVASYPQVFSDPSRAPVPFFAAIAAGFAILNSFIWNRRWTFQIRGKEGRLAELRRFYLVSIIGLLLNTFVTSLFVHIIPGHPKRSLALATVIAAAVVAIWNFSGQRLYAFRPKLK